ncbi:hypothetical protein RND71_039561 [Anisodus tanguticus]|uniref:Uncharacterized protein n=1 Tax=Anisodus tanguticus TaxID=243964 RepID=A0AAE1QWQ4_9SOLA|nr:hypothetical protein RND71_039561 [Anisodus tanguticus]
MHSYEFVLSIFLKLRLQRFQTLETTNGWKPLDSNTLEVRREKEMFNRSTLVERDILPKEIGSKRNILITQLFDDLEKGRESKENVEAENEKNLGAKVSDYSKDARLNVIFDQPRVANKNFIPYHTIIQPIPTHIKNNYTKPMDLLPFKCPKAQHAFPITTHFFYIRGKMHQGYQNSGAADLAQLQATMQAIEFACNSIQELKLLDKVELKRGDNWTLAPHLVLGLQSWESFEERESWKRAGENLGRFGREKIKGQVGKEIPMTGKVRGERVAERWGSGTFLVVHVREHFRTNILKMHMNPAAAEQTILSLSQSPRPYQACKYILENSQLANARFQAAGAIRDAALREWVFLEVDDKRGLIRYAVV